MTGSATGLSAEAGFRLLQSSLRAVTGSVVLAVSGGSDSVALLVLAAENRARFERAGIRFLVATVDHGLRPEAADEARDVVALAARYGLAHRILHWRPGGVVGNLQGAARRARYALLERAARDCGASCVLTAHHEDDQIETHLMAAERGEGFVRLAGMRANRALAPGLMLGRPFLAVPKADLVQSLRVRGLGWAEDPGNANPVFARARLRLRLAAMAMGERAQILRRIAAAQERRDLFDAAVAALLSAAHVDDLGGVRIDRLRFSGADAQPRAGLLSRALRAAGGTARQPHGSAVERLAARIGDGETFAATLGGCRIEADPEAIGIVREFGRSGPPPVAGGGVDASVLFDERFEIDVPAGLAAWRIVPLRALGRGGPRDGTLPVLVDCEGRAHAAHPHARARLGPGPAPLVCRERVSWRLAHDLADSAMLTKTHAKPAGPVGKEIAADYLPLNTDRAQADPFGLEAGPDEGATQDGR